MISKYWYDKIAASAAEAEQVLADAVSEENADNAAEEAADEAQEAEDIDEAASKEGTVDEARLQEDIMIAQEVAATDLPTDVKVEIMADQGVDPEIISEVIDADTTDAVAAYYGVNPYWLHDKRAAVSMAGAKALGKKALDAVKSYGRKGVDATKTYGKKGLDAATDIYDRMSPMTKGLIGGAALTGTAYELDKRIRGDKESSLGYLPPYLADKTASLTTGSAYLDDKMAGGTMNALKAAGNAVSKAWNKLPGKAKAAIGAATAGAALGGTARAAYKAGEKKQELVDRWNAGGNMLNKKD